MKAMVTGLNGFVGSYLGDYLVNEGIGVVGYDLREGHDLRNFEQLRNFIDKERPDYIFHLAAQAFVAESFANPQRAVEVNTIGSLNLLEAVRQLGVKTKILLAGTSEEYGEGEVTEDSKLEPASPYAIAKAAMDHFGQLYTKYGMHIVITRAFNHTGAGRGEMYAESAFAKQIVEVEKGKRKIIEHGNLDAIRNYTDVRDVVRAYRLAIDLPPDVYNICSDNNISIKRVLQKLVELSSKNVQTKVNPDLYRPFDFSFRPPSSAKFRELTGWRPEVTFDLTLSSILNYWRGKT